jgi:hypothetical protein
MVLGTRKKRDWSKYYTVDAVTGCWDWCKAIYQGTGYGAVWYEGHMQGAHVVFYRLFVGSIPEGYTLDHKCRRRSCVNPDHLEPVTHAINVQRGMHCQKRLRGIENGKQLTQRQYTVLSALIGIGGWTKAFDIKCDYVGESICHILRELVRRGWAASRPEHRTGARMYYEYTSTKLGNQVKDLFTVKAAA